MKNPIGVPNITAQSIPEEIRTRVIESFSDPMRSAYGQLATVSETGIPHVRTVHFHYRPERDGLVFNTNLKSQKWRELVHNPHVSLCYLDDDRNVQWRCEAKAQPESDPAFIKTMWMTMRREVRATYWDDAEPSNTDPNVNEPTSTFGCAVCVPYVWDVYDINNDDYRKGTRMIFVTQKKIWMKKDATLLYLRVQQ